jgi:hypothetical protein
MSPGAISPSIRRIKRPAESNQDLKYILQMWQNFPSPILSGGIGLGARATAPMDTFSLEENKMFNNTVEAEKASVIMDQYMSTFIKSDYTPWNKEYNCMNLPWCHYKVDIKTLDISNLSELDISSEKNVYCHDEQQKKLYQTDFKSVLDLVIALEPWEEIDVEIFDDSFDWTVAITHEGEVIFHGVDVVIHG